MKCPVCKEPDLLMTERQQIEIDYCPNCRGVWLDRGELDRLLEKTQAEVPVTAASQPPVQEARQSSYNQDAYYQQKYSHDKYYRKHDDDHYKHQKHYKRKSLLSEIFDF
jgi:uncharacterized protein